jgi:predicted nucleic acid-binding Zn ribbon protein
MRDDVKHELRQATIESSRSTEHLMALKATVLDRTQSLEIRLRAYMQIDAIMWAKRSLLHDRMGDTPTKIDIAKLNGERIRAERRRAKRIEAGLLTRPRRKHTVTGAWRSTERPDAIMSGYRICVVCAHPISDDRQRSETCSPKCQRAIRAGRRLTARAVGVFPAGPRHTDTP